ncbi:lactobacillus up-regulated protein [Aspergillus lentulus]|uniref:lactobacillus up-regulated protein n=1 Tax=Aspergillus lentulus TaxID=293939 RepID=UPI001395BF61|nr:lactobacillus up-regulated protein [Aspergillus lentulus]GFF37923.1 lactobacillus up-regulated protein [Aspergillus lentulus]
MRLTIKEIFSALHAAAATCAAAPTEEPSWRDLMSSFESTNLTDFIHLGDDRVLRHFNESGAVLNYAPLSPQQISQALSDTSSRDALEDKERFSEVFSGVDGRTVRTPALLNPPEEIYPTNLLNAKSHQIRSKFRDLISVWAQDNIVLLVLALPRTIVGSMQDAHVVSL